MSDETTATVDPAQMTGLELLRWMGTQVNDRPSIGRLLGMEMREVNEGSVSFALTPRADFSNPLGTVHGGICATLLDSVMGMRGTHDASRGRRLHDPRTQAQLHPHCASRR
ncbi:acyl-coenzyme A thioesterase PaaI-like protein [Rhodococcus sp. OAS809]